MSWCRASSAALAESTSVNPEVGLIVEDGANALSNDWVLVDYEKPDHVTDIRSGVST
jgi:hypothetical protein